MTSTGEPDRLISSFLIAIAGAIYRDRSKYTKMGTLANRVRQYTWNKLKTTEIFPIRNAIRGFGHSIMNPYRNGADSVIPFGQ
jgi:hypothetical protein